MGKPKYIEVMRAEQAPDVYSGPNCDEHRPDWRTNELGSKSPDEGGMDVLTLVAEHFPAGTKIVISVPVCPECGDDAQSQHDGKCGCGFDWEAWASDQYSQYRPRETDLPLGRRTCKLCQQIAHTGDPEP